MNTGFSGNVGVWEYLILDWEYRDLNRSEFGNIFPVYVPLSLSVSSISTVYSHDRLSCNVRYSV